ncbi:AMP-binding protein, partial [Rhodococcus koreensis]
VRILETIAGDPGTVVGDVEVLGAGERGLVVGAWNATSHVVPATTVVELFEAQVVRSPGAPAVVFEGGVLSYGEFAARVHRLARWLIGEGVGPESSVGVAVRRSVDMVVGIYAVLVAGGAYVPIDPDQPSERVGYVVGTVAPVVVLTTAADVGVFAGSVRVVAVDTLDVSGLPAGPVGVGERSRLLPGHPGYVMFTSGSTGRPKGVSVPHGGIVNRLLWMQDRYPLQSDDVVLQKTPVTFDVSVWELFWPLLCGA